MLSAVITSLLYIFLIGLRVASRGILGLVAALLALKRAWWLVTRWQHIRRQRLAPLSLAELYEAPAGEAICGVVSDLHLTTHNDMPQEFQKGREQKRGKPPTGQSLEMTTRDLLVALDQCGAGTVIVAGDITDEGSVEQWKRAATLLLNAPPNMQFLVVAGNHDINLNKATVPDRDGKQRVFREQRYDQFLQRLGMNGRLRAEAAMPALVRIGDVHVILLDSNRYPSRHLASNAIGLFGADQLGRLDEILLDASIHDLIVVSHHHVFLHQGEVARLVEDPWLIAMDGEHVLERLAKHARDRGSHVLLIHGHRHIETYGAYPPDGDTQVHVYGMPSSTSVRGSMTQLMASCSTVSSATLSSCATP